MPRRSTSVHNLQQASRAERAVLGYHTGPLTFWFLAVITAIGIRFWPYWSTLL